MSHRNGKIYIDTSTTPPTGISIDDIYAVIGSGADAYNDPRVNKWAKYKPIEHNSPGTTTDAHRKAALQGMSIPAYTSAAALTQALRAGITEGAHWTRDSITTFERIFDVDGYLHTNHVTLEWGAQGAQSSEELNFPFAGRIWTSDTPLRPYSLMDLATIEPEDPELHPTGLLYPSDWAGTTLPFSDWYFGVLCTPANVPASGNTDLWIITNYTQLKNCGTGNYLLEDVPFAQSGTTTPLGTGSYLLFPIMCSRNTWDGQGTPYFQNFKNNWGSEAAGPGKLVLIDGFRLPVTIVSGGGELEITFSVSNGNVNMSIKNDTRLPVTFDGNQMFGYIVTDYVAGRRTDVEEVEDAADDWVDNATEYTLGVKNSNDILVGRHMDMIGYFRQANNNSSVIPAQTTVTFSVPIGASTDGYGQPYDSDSELFFCYKFHVQGMNPERRYEELEQ